MNYELHLRSRPYSEAAIIQYKYPTSPAFYPANPISTAPLGDHRYVAKVRYSDRFSNANAVKMSRV